MGSREQRRQEGGVEVGYVEVYRDVGVRVCGLLRSDGGPLRNMVGLGDGLGM